MPLPRNRLVALEATPNYHVISRCVRRQYLCGLDSETGRDFSHRRGWIRERIFELAEIFAVEVCAYAVMSNHFHLVVSIREEQALDWDPLEVARRWQKLFGGNPLVRRLVNGDSLTKEEEKAAERLIEKYRERLFDLSWFMRCLNEPIARMANDEDNVTGRFWEGRFKSQALLDEGALLSAMAYVDLNPIRASMAETPEESDYTSIQQRILERDPNFASADKTVAPKPPEDLQKAIDKLMPFSDQKPDDPERAIPYGIQDYLELVDWSGRAIIEGKRGKIPDSLPPMLDRLKVNPDQYLRFIQRKQSNRFHNAIGAIDAMRSLAVRFGKSFLKGQTAAAQLFSPG